MKAALLYRGERELRLVESSPRPLKKGEATIRVLASGLCGSDLKILRGVLELPTYPQILGHEIMGRVVEARPSGPGEERAIEALDGRNVLVHPYCNCGQCDYCLSNRANLCTARRRLGWEVPGGFAEEANVPVGNLVPTSLGEEASVLTDAGATTLHALRKVPFSLGTPVAIMGVGGLGAFAVQIARLMGGQVIALDRSRSSLSLAEKLGSNLALDTASTSPEEAKKTVASEMRGRLPGVFVDFVGNEQSLALAMALLAPGGRLLQVGYSPAAYTNMATKEVVYRELQLLGSLASTVGDLRDMVALVETGRVKLDVTRRYALDDVNMALRDLDQNKVQGRAIVAP